MANKKYPDFPPGTYDTTKIFLQSDPVTGALEKVNLPAISGSNIFSAADLINALNTGSNPQTISTLTIPANTISQDGMYLRWNVFFSSVSGAGIKTVTIGFAGTIISTPSSNSNGIWQIQIHAIRLSSTQLMILSMQIRGTTIVGLSANTTISIDPTISNNLECIVTSGAAGEIRMLWQELTIGNP